MTVLSAELELVPIPAASALAVLGIRRHMRRRRRGACGAATPTGRAGGNRSSAGGARTQQAPGGQGAAPTARRKRMADGAVRRRTTQDDADARAHAMIDDLREATRTRPSSMIRLARRRYGRRVRPGSAPRPTLPGEPTPTRAGRTRPSRRTGSATICATSATCWTATTTAARRCTGTSARAACTPASRFELAHRRGRGHLPPVRGRRRRLVVRYGGSLSGEHGDGQSRGELLPIMFGDRVVDARSKRSKPFSIPATG